MRDRDRQRENRRVFAGGAVVTPRPSSPGSSSGPCTARTRRPSRSWRRRPRRWSRTRRRPRRPPCSRRPAVLSFAEGHLGTALELSEQALGKWPQYNTAQRFTATAVPQATAVEQSVQARATAGRCWRGRRRAKPPGASTAPGRGCCSSATPTRWGSSRSGTARPGSGRSCCGTPSGAGAPRRPWSTSRAPPPSSPRWGRGPRTWPPRRRSSPSSPARRRSWRRDHARGLAGADAAGDLLSRPAGTAPATCSTKPTLQRRRAVPRRRRRPRSRAAPAAGAGAPDSPGRLSAAAAGAGRPSSRPGARPGGCAGRAPGAVG